MKTVNVYEIHLRWNQAVFAIMEAFIQPVMSAVVHKIKYVCTHLKLKQNVFVRLAFQRNAQAVILLYVDLEGVLKMKMV